MNFNFSSEYNEVISDFMQSATQRWENLTSEQIFETLIRYSTKNGEVDYNEVGSVCKHLLTLMNKY
jgi:hypothetical protein